MKKMEKNIAIGIEGLVGSGKTSICKELLDRIPNSILIHGGNFYRGIVYAYEQKKKIKNFDELSQKTQKIDMKDIMEKLKVQFKVKGKETVVYVDGKEIPDEELQSAHNSLAVSVASHVADNQALFQYIHDIIEKLKKEYNLIISGRAIMEIYPDVEEHILVTASLEERVRRKWKQYQGKISEEELTENIIKRDKLQEATGFYKKYDKTKVIDVTECKNAKESTDKILQYFGEWANKYITLNA